jgi:multidrug efflux pump subunit AcrB
MSQPDGNTVAIADALQRELAQIRRELPPDTKLAFFYDQSLFVREGVRSVWESIILGLGLSVLVLYVFLRSVPETITAAAVIPVTVLLTLVGMRAFHMSFNLMTLGGIAAAIGVIIDDAIVVVEAIHAKMLAGHTARQAVRLAGREIGLPLVGSTLTPVVVFIPLAFLDGVPGVFFRALAMTMVFALLTSLVLAVTFTPALGSLLMRSRKGPTQVELEQGGRVLRGIIRVYEWTVRRALRFSWLAVVCILLVALGAGRLYQDLETDFLPSMEEGAFVLDYFTRPGTSLSETDRMLRHVEEILIDTPEVESFSRRTGARLALAIAEPNTGDFLVKLRGDRQRNTEEVIAGLRDKIRDAEPALNTEFPGVLSDLIGDLTWSPDPCEIKIFTNDTGVLKEKAAAIAATIEKIPGVVDVNDGLVVAGPSMRFLVRPEAAARADLTPADVGGTLETAMLGSVSSYLLRGDRIVDVRVLNAAENRKTEHDILETPVRSASGTTVTLGDVAQVDYEPGILEMQRDDLRQLVAVTARFEGMDLGKGIRTIQAHLGRTLHLPPGVSLEYGGMYRQQQESFKNLAMVLLMAIFLVFAVLLVEFRSFIEPLAIVMGAVLALCGVIAALYVSGISLNIVSFLGAIIGIGIVAKNGILMLDFVDHLRDRGYSLFEALVQSGRRRLRPVLMTSLTTFLGLLPLAYGVGAGADMLRPLAIAVIGALFISLILSLVATPVCYYVMMWLFRLDRRPVETTA